MATTALEVVSLAEIKTELRRPSGDTSLDGLLQDQISTAVSYVSQRTHLPLVERQERCDVPPPYSDYPLLLPPFIKSVDSVVYWTPDQKVRESPGGVIDVSELGRIDALEDYVGTHVYPPSGGWPDVAPGFYGRYGRYGRYGTYDFFDGDGYGGYGYGGYGYGGYGYGGYGYGGYGYGGYGYGYSDLRITTTRGYDLQEESRSLRHAVILGVRELYGGYREGRGVYSGDMGLRSSMAMERMLEPWIYYGTRRKGGIPVSTTPTPTPTPTHTLYALVTAGSATPSASDFLAAASTTANDIEVPAHGQGYLHFADTRSSLSDIKEQGSAFSSRAFFSDTPTPLEINGVQHYVYSSKGALFAHNQPQVWELTS